MSVINSETLLSAAEIRAVPIQECGEPLIDIKKIAGLTYGPPPEYPATEPDYTWLRKGVFERLLTAQSCLPSSQRLRLYEGFRSLRVQAQLFERERERVMKRNPSLSIEEAFLETCRLVSPVTYFDGTQNIPPHNTGGAVDVEIIDLSGGVIDFGMEIREWATVNPALCKTLATGLTPQAQNNRALLVEIMTESGFVNYSEEWWHFSYGDRYWARKSGHDFAIYGSVEAHLGGSNG